MIADFESVWERVKGADPKTTEPLLLQELITRKRRDIALYRAMRQKTGFAQFQRLENEEREQHRILQTHYYLLTGDSAVCTQETSNVPHGQFNAIRCCYQRELENSELLIQYSKRFTTSVLQALCETLARKETAHAELLCTMAKRYL